jgi:tetratricopeptide (TPR) repeat protein
MSIDLKDSKSMPKILRVSLLLTIFSAHSCLSVFAQDALWERYTATGVEATKHNDFALAESSFQAALHRAEKFNTDDKVRATSYDNVADTKYKAGHYADAEPYYKKSIACLQRCVTRDAAMRVAQDEQLKMRRELINEMDEMADCYRAETKYFEAEQIYRQALATENGADLDAEVQKANVKSRLGDVLSLQNKFDEAEKLYKESLPVFEKAHNDRLILDLLEDYDALLRMTKRAKEADAMEDRIKTIHPTPAKQ